MSPKRINIQESAGLNHSVTGSDGGIIQIKTALYTCFYWQNALSIKMKSTTS